VPPVFIIVCNNTATSKLVYDYISGFHRKHEDGSTTLENGRLGLFRNYDDNGNRLPSPRTLLIDSEQLESGEALDKDFREIASDEIERFRREIVERTRDIRAGEKITDQDLLREVMNTVGKPGQLGESIRCVVSVSMLTELNRFPIAGHRRSNPPRTIAQQRREPASSRQTLPRRE
jgi:type III restriction enzyme